ncbi:tetracenomycin polyketide synthesis 8-O-methyl transferase TcmO-like [Sycon ciliatum]|uniref:tetracenomycin polyketide synthesis 8-O-methyl transferase TcmO-like n=1 Tax=Sycon ciliatum TaxID=27933 RepID=UPI0020AD84C9
MASTSSVIAPESVPPTVAEVTVYEKIIELMNTFKKTHAFRSAIELGVFKAVHGAARSAHDIGARCEVHDSTKLIALLDLLAAEGILKRCTRGEGEEAVILYENNPGADLLLGDEALPNYAAHLGTMLGETQAEMARWANLTEILKTGAVKEKPQQHSHSHGHKSTADDGAEHGEEKKKVRNCHAVDDNDKATTEEEEEWSKLYEMFEGFMRIGFNVVAEKFDFSRFTHVVDIGGGTAQLSRILCRRYKNLNCTNFDLPRMLPCAEKRMAEIGADVADRVRLVGGDCFKDDLPTPVDAVIIANVMHGFDNDELRSQLVQKAHDALSPGGVFIVIEDIINPDHSNESALLWQLSMDVMIASADQGHKHHHTMLTLDGLSGWLKAAGFHRQPQVIPLVGSMQAVIATKA